MQTEVPQLEAKAALPVAVKTFPEGSKARLPQYQTEGAAGVDIHATEDMSILPMTVGIVPTGLFMAIPVGHELQIRSRSGLAAKNSVCVLNSPGTIDSDYRGEIRIILINLGTESFDIKAGDRIGQGVLAEYVRMDFVFVDELEDTERGSGGFGHSGV